MDTKEAAIQLLHANEVLDDAKDLNEAIHMACGYISNTSEKNAIQAVSDALRHKLIDVFDKIEEVREALRTTAQEEIDDMEGGQ